MNAQPYATLTAAGDGVEFRSSYSPGLVAAFKAAVPPTARRWNPTGKVWLVAAQYATVCADLARQHLGVEVQLPIPGSRGARPEIRLVRLEYLGAAKERGGDEPVAYGYAGGDWTLAFPLSALRAWFDPDGAARPGDAGTLYAVLGVGRAATEEEIKKAYRRAARTWHPDVCKEPDAAGQFRRVQEAYEVLRDRATRRKYDAGLALTANSGRGESLPQSGPVWRPPLRCGYVLVECTPQLGRLVVGRIVQWEDITDAGGRVMVTFWPQGKDMFEARWV